MKRILLAMVFSTTLYAQDPLLELKSLSASYNDPSGQGSINSLFIKDLYNIQDKTSFNLEKQASKITLKIADEYVEFESFPDFIHELQTFKIQDFNSKVENHKLNISLNHMNGQATDMGLILEGLSLNCFKDNNKTQVFLNNCINGKSNFKLNYVSYKQEKDIIVKNINLDVGENTFKVSLKTKGQNIKGNGIIRYDEQNNEVSIKIEKIKAGFISVKGMVFKELEKIESENIKVNKPWITIQTTPSNIK